MENTEARHVSTGVYSDEDNRTPAATMVMTQLTDTSIVGDIRPGKYT